MLSELNIIPTIELSYIGLAPPFPIQTFNFIDNNPKNLAWVSTITTAGALTVLSSFIFRDEFGSEVFQMSIIPWQFAGTTVSTVTVQTPDPNNVPLFATNLLGGYIPSGFHVFNDWTYQFLTFGSDPGDSTIAVLGLNNV